jgi:hypothetical protein
MVRIELWAKTKEELKDKIDSYYFNWPDEGYGTYILDPKQLEDGTWAATGSRGDSCD